jgi:lipid-A-disaccharide synthase
MQALKIAIVAGEESGDLLGADLVDAISRLTGRPIELVGVGGRHLEARGLNSLFDGSQIALMGVTAVVKDRAAEPDRQDDRGRTAGLPHHHRQP